MMLSRIYILGLLICLTSNLWGQAEPERFENLKNQLDVLIINNPGLEEQVDLSVSGVPLGEFIRALGTTNKVNLSIDPGIRGSVTHNFSDVSVAEVLLFLAKEFELDFKITGNIIHIEPYGSGLTQIAVIKDKKIIYDLETDLITMDLKKDSLYLVTKALTQATSKNIVFQPGLENQLLSVYLEKVPFDKAMEQLSYANNLTVRKTQDNFYLIEKPQNQSPDGNTSGNLRFLDLTSKEAPSFNIDSNLISLNINDEPLDRVIRGLFRDLDINYYLYSTLKGNTTLNVKSARLNDLLTRMFAGTNYTFLYQDSVYVIGEANITGLQESRKITIRNRTVEGMLEYLPAELLDGLQVNEFNELNSLLVSGPFPKVEKLERFIKSIDQPVPVVIIEVMIVDYQKSYNISSGIEAGIGDQPVQSGGKLYPAIDYNLGAESINKLIASFNGFGALNLGPVTPNFYLSLQLMEANGILNVRSTPKLSTINGHEATISIGNTEYYVVEQTNVTGVQNPLPITTRNYQSVEANFSITIRPMVSADDQVTLEINVEQSDFTARLSPEAPPGSVSRKFTSLIRVKDNEMILLGGLEEKRVNDEGSGVPFVSRIPIIKWFFSSRSRTNESSKLNVFIKPTIIN